MDFQTDTFAAPEKEVTEFEFNSFHRMPSRNHGRLQTRIAANLENKYGQEFSILTAVDLDLSTGKAVPDISIYPQLPTNWDEDEVKMTTAPITTIEILSPRQAMTDLTDKNNQIYFPAGVKSSWIVVPMLQQMTIVRPGQPKLIFSGGIAKDPATGIELNLDLIFQ